MQKEGFTDMASKCAKEAEDFEKVQNFQKALEKNTEAEKLYR